jgi:hypothetical protein
MMAPDKTDKPRSKPMTSITPESLIPFQLATMLARRPSGGTSYSIAVDCANLIKAAKSIAALALADCNYGLTPRQETRRENLAKACNAIAAKYGLKAKCYGGPRGFTVRLDGPEVEKNGWGDGFGIA